MLNTDTTIQDLTQMVTYRCLVMNEGDGIERNKMKEKRILQTYMTGV